MKPHESVPTPKMFIFLNLLILLLKFYQFVVTPKTSVTHGSKTASR